MVCDGDSAKSPCGSIANMRSTEVGKPPRSAIRKPLSMSFRGTMLLGTEESACSGTVGLTSRSLARLGMTAVALFALCRKTWIWKHLVRGFDEHSKATQETMAAQSGISPGLCFPETRDRHRAAVDRRPQPGRFEPCGGGSKNGNNTIDRHPAGERKAAAKRQQP